MGAVCVLLHELVGDLKSDGLVQSSSLINGGELMVFGLGVGLKLRALPCDVGALGIGL